MNSKGLILAIDVAKLQYFVVYLIFIQKSIKILIYTHTYKNPGAF